MHFRLAWMLLGFLSLSSQNASYADDIDTQRRALQLIRDTAADICTTVAREGSSQSAELSGDVKAKLGGVIGKVVDLGIEGAGKYASSEYKNVLQKDLATLIQSNTNCRLDVFKLLQEKMIGPAKAGAPANKPPIASGNATTNARGGFQHDSVKVVGRYVRYTQWLDGTQSCWNGAVCGTASFLLENLSGTPFNAAIKAGTTSIGPCIGRETEAAGLKIYNNNPGWSNNVSFDSAQTYVPLSAKIPVTIKLENCASANSRSVDVSVTLTVSADGKVFDLPVSVTDVPVR
jgi:hypothetical protein